MAALARVDAAVQDVEQVLVRGHLTLATVVSAADGAALERAAAAVAEDHGLHLGISTVPAGTPPLRRADVVTLLGYEIPPAAISQVANAIGLAGGNIDRIVRLSKYPVMTIEMRVTGANPEDLRRRTAAIVREHGVDIAVQEEGLGRRAKRLLTIDVDSTLIQDEVIDLMAEEAGCVDDVRALTAAAMAGDIDFEDALRRRVALLAGLDVAALERVASRVRATPGARTFVRTLNRLGFQLVAVSGGFHSVIDDLLLGDLGLHRLHANTLEIADGRLTGRLDGPIVDRRRKADLLREEAAHAGVPMSQTIAVGDGANDIDMLSAAGLGIAFNGKAAVRAAADASISVPFLDAILFLLGVNRDDVEREHLTRAEPPEIVAPERSSPAE